MFVSRSIHARDLDSCKSNRSIVLLKVRIRSPSLLLLVPVPPVASVSESGGWRCWHHECEREWPASSGYADTTRSRQHRSDDSDRPGCCC